MNGTNWTDMIGALSSPIELQTGKQKKWFRASTENEHIVINVAVDNLPSCDLAAPRSIREKEYMRIIPYYLRWKNGEHGVRKLALNISQNTTYIFALIVYIKKKNTNS